MQVRTDDDGDRNGNRIVDAHPEETHGIEMVVGMEDTQRIVDADVKNKTGYGVVCGKEDHLPAPERGCECCHNDQCDEESSEFEDPRGERVGGYREQKHYASKVGEAIAQTEANGDIGEDDKRAEQDAKREGPAKNNQKGVQFADLPALEMKVPVRHEQNGNVAAKVFGEGNDSDNGSGGAPTE